MALQPSNKDSIDRATTSPFLLRLFWRQNRPLEPWEFSVAPPADTSDIVDYTSLLPSNIRQQSVQIYTWPTCTLSELTGLLSSVLPAGVRLEVGTRVNYRLIFPDTRGGIVEGGRGKWLERPLGYVAVGGRNAALDGDDANEPETKDSLEGDADKTLADGRFVIGDYVACTISSPQADGRTRPPMGGRGPRDPYVGQRGAPMRENGFGGGYRGGRGGYGSGRGSGFGAAPPPGDWRRGDRPPMGGGYRGRGGGRLQ